MSRERADINYRDIAATLLRCYVIETPDPVYVEEFAETVREIVEHDGLDIPKLPTPDETLAITLSSPKVAALAFDRVWSIPASNAESIPADIAVYGATEMEIWAQASQVLWQSGERPLPTVTKYLDAATTIPRNQALRTIAGTLATRRQIFGTPLYDSAEAYALEYRPGASAVITAVIESVAVPDESRLTWQQVIEFRRDRESLAAYRRFVHWLDKDCIGKSAAFIQQEVTERLEAYQRSLSRHGVETTIGAIEAILDPAFLAGASALLAGVAFAVSTPVAVISTLAASASKIACRVAKGLIDREAAEYGNDAQIAYIHSLQKATLRNAG